MNKKLIQYFAFTLAFSTVPLYASAKRRDTPVHTNRNLVTIIYDYAQQIERLQFKNEQNLTEDHIQRAMKIVEISSILDDILTNNPSKISSSMQSSMAKAASTSKSKYSKIIAEYQNNRTNI